jgi:hypothetical protein
VRLFRWLPFLLVVVGALGVSALALGFKPHVPIARSASGSRPMRGPVTVSSPTPAPVREHTPPGPSMPVGIPSFQGGINVLLTGSDPAYQRKANLLFARLRSLEVNSVALAFPVYQDDRFATAVHAGAGTPADQELAELIDLAHAYRLAVTLRPLLDERSLGSGHWRGDIAPSSVPAWFASYTSLVVGLGQLAQGHGTEVVVLGGEFDSIEPYTERWTAMARAVRRVYLGKLTYASNVTVQPGAQVRRVGFWSALDFVGADLYLPSNAPAGATASELAQSWQADLRQLLTAASAAHRPLLVTEIGVRAQADAHRRPWIWDNGGAEDLGEQDRFYRAACATVPDHVRGMYWWQTSLDGAGDPSGFNPLGRPAEQQLRACLPAQPS